MQPRLYPLAVGIVALGLVGCFADRPAEEAPRHGGTNVFVIVLDATSAAFTSPYGAADVATPHMGAFARDSVVFENAYSQSATTVPSTASLFTGTRVMTHRMGWFEEQLKLPILPEILREHGYRSLGFVGNPNAGAPNLGFHRGYEIFTQLYALTDMKANPEVEESKLHVVYPEDVNRHVAELLPEIPADHGFVYIHFLQPHAPYDPPEEHLGGAESVPWAELNKELQQANWTRNAAPHSIRRLRRHYRGNLHYADAGFGDLMASLRKAGLLERSLVILMSDHGEAFFGHRWFGHNHTLYDDMTRIPLIFRFPERDGIEPRRIPELVETVDVLPTVLDYLGIPIPGFVEGESLWPLIAGSRDELEGDEVVLATHTLESHAIRSGDYKYILNLDSDDELYDLRRDPDEKTNLLTREPERAEALRTRLLTFIDPATIDRGPRMRRVRTVDPEMKELLEMLGYTE